MARQQPRLVLRHQKAVEVAPAYRTSQMNRAADHRMPGKGDLGGGKEDADTGSVVRVLRCHDEDCFGQDEFARKRLHLRSGQPAGPQNDGQRVSGKGPVGKDTAGPKAWRGC